MNMHDKDIDQLFHSKLDDFEMEPSASVWDNISTELHGTADRRKRLIPLLRIAASVMVLIGAGWFFLPKGKKADQTQPVKKIVKVSPGKIPVNAPQTVGTPQINTATQMQQATGTQPQQQIAALPKVKTQTIVPANNINTPVIKQAVVDPDKTEAIANTQPATVLAATQNKPATITQPVVPDQDISLKATDPALNVATKPILAAANIPADGDIKQTPAKKHKARGLGGILNAMIGAVDKRQDKIIEFADTDEGDTVTGINLGIVKIKKQN